MMVQVNFQNSPQQICNTPPIGENVFSDLDNDGDLDVIIIGTQDGGIPNIFNIVYENQGNNVFVPVDTIGGEYIATAVAEDFNGDGLPDIIIQGFVDKMNVYWNTSVVTTSIGELIENISLNMFPNPVNDILHIEYFSLVNENIQIIVMDISGKIIYEQSKNILAGEQHLDIDISTWSSGYYLLNISNGVENVPAKFLKL
jgi:hypothetical protein